MLTSRRDYLLRIIDEVSRLLARAFLKRREGETEAALHTVVQASERLFNLEAHELFQFTPEQQFLMLTEGAEPDDARAKVLIYAALNLEAGRSYAALKKPELARGSWINALRFTCRAHVSFPTDTPPDYAPRIPELLTLLADEPLDPDTAALVRAATN
ncbi:MAG: hypothetical protein ABIZ49_09920 [Opitutaceae bacterium]